MTRGRPHLALGQAGTPWVTKKETGGYTAGCYVRLKNGRRRQVTASGASKGAAQRNLQRKIESMVEASPDGVQPTWTVGQLATHWLQHKSRTGHARRGTPLRPQSRWNYSHTITRMIVPALGDIRLHELTVPVLESVLHGLEDTGLSTRQARSVLRQALDLGVRDGALPSNPLTLIAPPPREQREVEALDVNEARYLLEVVRPERLRIPGRRGPNGDLHAFCTLALATGARVSEILAITRESVDLNGPAPTVTISGTLVEPRAGHIEAHHRQEATKGHTVRTLILPDAAADLVDRRLSTASHQDPKAPLLASRSGAFLWSANVRTRLRNAVTGEPLLTGTTPHTLRRTVGSHLAYEAGVDAARRQLGHSITGATPLASYVAYREEAPDLRQWLNAFFDAP